MRQVFVGRAGATDAADGTVRLEELDASGNWVTYAGSTTGKLRVVQHKNGDIAKRVSPTFTAAEANCSVEKHVDPSKQNIDITFAGNGTSGEKATFKVIDTTPGYEPFTRFNVEFTMGASATASATALELAIDAERAVNAEFAATIDAPTDEGDGSLDFDVALGKRVELALDCGDMATAADLTVVKSAGLSGVGDYDSVKLMEELQAGREHTNYDQLVAFGTMPAQVNAEVGQTYHLTHISFRNNYKGGVGQINGVDNFRDLYVYTEEDTAVDIYGGLTATAGGWFDDITTATLIGTNPLVDDPE